MSSSSFASFEIDCQRKTKTGGQIFLDETQIRQFLMRCLHVPYISFVNLKSLKCGLSYMIIRFFLLPFAATTFRAAPAVPEAPPRLRLQQRLRRGRAAATAATAAAGAGAAAAPEQVPAAGAERRGAAAVRAGGRQAAQPLPSQQGGGEEPQED